VIPLFFVLAVSTQINSQQADKPKAVLNVEVDEALDQMYNIWKGDFAGRVSIAIKNNMPFPLEAFGVTPESGFLITPLPNILPNKTGIFMWETSKIDLNGARGVIHYRYRKNQVINLMLHVPFDWNFYYAWSNVHVTKGKTLDSYYNLYNGKGGCRLPTRAGSWGTYYGIKYFLTYRKKAEFKVIISNRFDNDSPLMQQSSTISAISTPNIQSSTISEISTPNIQSSTISEISTPNIQSSTISEISTPNIQSSTISEISTPNIETTKQ